MPRSSRRRLGGWLGLGWLCLGLLGLGLTPAASASAVAAAAPGASLCGRDEKPVMVCQVKAKQAALCAQPAKPPFSALSYRYGRPGRVELTHTVRTGDPAPFGASVNPAGPQALVHQVWFDRGNTRYVLTACEGGQCAHRGGLIVLGRQKLISARPCSNPSDQAPAFSRDVVEFGSDLGDSRSSTDLLRFEDTDNQIDTLYPPAAARPR